MSRTLSLAQFKAVLFDVDGTLVDSLDMLRYGLADAIERFSHRRPTSEEILSLIGMPLADQLLLFAPEEPVEAMVNYAIERYEAHKNHERPFPEALEALECCREAGLPVALVTSKNAKELELFLGRFTHADFITTAVCASDVPRPKPYPDCALLACERLGAQPSDAVFIGDSVFDIRCGKSAGTATIAVAYGSATRDVLCLEQPDMILDSPADLLAWTRDDLLVPTCRERN